MPASPLGVTYYPSCVVNLRVKFDESYQANANPTTTVTQGELAKTTLVANLAQLNLAINSEANKTGSHIVGRIPIKASVELQTIRKPGKFTLVFDYRVLPIDPRLIRSAAVEIYMDSVAATDFAQGVTAASSTSGERISQLTAANRSSMLNPTTDNLVLQGLADTWRVEHTASGSRVTLEGRDLTGLFLNTPILPEMVAGLNLEQPIDQVVREIAHKVNLWGQDLNILPDPAARWPDGKIPMLANLTQLDASVPRVRITAKGKKARRSPGAKIDKLNFWDLITRYCGFVGAVPYITVAPDPVTKVYKSTIMIRPQQTLWDQLELSSTNFPSPYKNQENRRDDAGQPFKIRRLMFGRNIEELNIERKFQGVTARAVRVVCYNPSAADRNSRFLEAISTARQTFAQQAVATDNDAAGRSSVSPNGEYGAKDVLTIQVYGIKDQKQLQQVADGLYNEIMRGQAGGTVKTRNLSSFGAGNEDPDLIRIRPMDGIALMVDARQLQPNAPSVSPLNKEWQQSAAQWQAALAKELNDENLASAIVATTRSSNMQYNSTYRVNAVRFDWDVKSGIAVSLDFHNYVTPRNSIYPTAPVATPEQIRQQGTSVPGRAG